MNPYPDARPGSVPGSVEPSKAMPNTLIEKRKERRSK